MKIAIVDIPLGGLDVSADTSSDDWLGAVLCDALGDRMNTRNHVHLEAKVTNVNGNIHIDGKISFKLYETCDRCLEEYCLEGELPLVSRLSPLYTSPRQRRLMASSDVELVREDLDFEFYSGDDFDFGAIVREKLVLAQPIKHLCSEGCKGLCPICGGNRNLGECRCVEQASVSFREQQ